MSLEKVTDYNTYLSDVVSIWTVSGDSSSSSPDKK